MGTIADVPNPEAIQRLFSNARKALESVEQNKQMVVKKLAEDLEYVGFPLDTICEKITDELEGYISRSYVKACLEEKYKNRKHVRKNVTIEGATSGLLEDKKVLEVSLTTDGKPANYDEEMKQLYNNARNGHYTSEEETEKDSKIEELELENERQRELMKEQKDQITELINSVNAASTIKENNKIPIPAKQSTEYKAIVSELELVKQERDELKQLASMQMKANPSQTFQTAASITTTSSTKPAATAKQIEFPANLFGKFFIATRNVRKSLFLKLDEVGKVIGWVEEQEEENATTSKATENQVRQEAQPA